MKMMKCLGDVMIQTPSQTIKLWASTLDQPCLVDFDRVLVAAKVNAPAVGKPGDENYQPATTAAPAYTVADAVKGRDELFVPADVPQAPVKTSPAVAPAAEVATEKKA